MLTIRDPQLYKAYSTRLYHFQADLIWCDCTFNSLLKSATVGRKNVGIFLLYALLASIVKRNSLTYHDHTSTRWLISAK